jgi:hypothetical protein
MAMESKELQTRKNPANPKEIQGLHEWAVEDSNLRPQRCQREVQFADRKKTRVFELREAAETAETAPVGDILETRRMSLFFGLCLLLINRRPVLQFPANFNSPQKVVAMGEDSSEVQQYVKAQVDAIIEKLDSKDHETLRAKASLLALEFFGAESKFRRESLFSINEEVALQVLRKVVAKRTSDCSRASAEVAIGRVNDLLFPPDATEKT